MQVVRVGDEGDTGPSRAGFVTATRTDDEWHFLATIGRDLPPEDVERFVLWADEISRRMVDYGPAADGWEPGADGRWRRRARPADRHTG